MPLSIPETKERLRDLELLRECSDADLDRVAAVARNEVRFEPGDVLYEEGATLRNNMALRYCMKTFMYAVLTSSVETPKPFQQAF